MGSKAARMARFRAEHPVCYFCATEPTQTEDHVPSRECFRNRVWPEGYAFPACLRCNNSASKLEQVVALYMLLGNHDDPDPPIAQLNRLMNGVRNNNPDLMPRIGLSANEARRWFRVKGVQLPPGQTYKDAPVAELPEGNRDAFELFARRLTCALYYKEVGSPLPLDWYIGTSWVPCAEPVAQQTADAALRIFPELRMTNRTNTDIGDQFCYLWGFKAEYSLFGHLSQFARSFLIFGGAVGPIEEGRHESWKPHSGDVAALERLVSRQS